MRLALLLLLIPLFARAQGLAGSESVILRVDAESIYAHLFRPAALGRRPAMVILHGFGGVSDAREAGELATNLAPVVLGAFLHSGEGRAVVHRVTLV